MSQQTPGDWGFPEIGTGLPSGEIDLGFRVYKLDWADGSPYHSPDGVEFSVTFGNDTLEDPIRIAFARECVAQFRALRWGVVDLYPHDRYRNVCNVYRNRGEVYGIYRNAEHQYDLLALWILPNPIILLCYAEEYLLEYELPKGWRRRN